MSLMRALLLGIAILCCAIDPARLSALLIGKPWDPPAARQRSPAPAGLDSYSIRTSELKASGSERFPQPSAACSR